jgi:F-type H+-transporting ATPase subunit b
MATPTAGTHVPGTPPPFPPFQRETFASQLIWLTLAFVLLYVLMAKIGLPRVAAILQARRETIEGSLAEAQRYREQSEAALAGYEKLIVQWSRHASQQRWYVIQGKRSMP